MTRHGFVAIVGRPNVGKSTLINALAGGKVSIVSHRRQTTRGILRAAFVHSGSQCGLLDSPGWQTRHGGTFNRRLNAGAEWAATAADVVVFVCAAPQWTKEDADFLSRLPAALPMVAAVNKTDLAADNAALLPLADDVRRQRDFAAIVPLCARRGQGISVLKDEVTALLPESPPLFDDEEITTVGGADANTVLPLRDKMAANADFFLGELLREKVYHALGDELPYSIGVLVRRTGMRGKAAAVSARILVERESQKAIVIGAGGAQLKKIAAAARYDMERALGERVYLTVRVKVAADWRRNENLLRQMRVGAPADSG